MLTACPLASWWQLSPDAPARCSSAPSRRAVHTPPPSWQACTGVQWGGQKTHMLGRKGIVPTPYGVVAGVTARPLASPRRCAVDRNFQCHAGLHMRAHRVHRMALLPTLGAGRHTDTARLFAATAPHDSTLHDRTAPRVMVGGRAHTASSSRSLFFFCKRAAGARDGPAKRRRKEPARWAQRKVSARILSQPTSALGQSCMCSTRVLLQREVSGIPRTGCSSDEACEASESVIESGREVGRACRMGPVGARRSAAGLATTARSFDSRSGTWIETVFLISANNV